MCLLADIYPHIQCFVGEHGKRHQFHLGDCFSSHEPTSFLVGLLRPFHILHHLASLQYPALLSRTRASPPLRFATQFLDNNCGGTVFSFCDEEAEKMLVRAEKRDFVGVPQPTSDQKYGFNLVSGVPARPPRFFSRVKLQSSGRVLRSLFQPGATQLCFSTHKSTYIPF